MNSPLEWWHAHYGSLPPIAHLLRQQILERWVRLHSLPDSKRYAESAEEDASLLARHNEIATEILGSKSHCTVFVWRFCELNGSEDQTLFFPQLEKSAFRRLGAEEISRLEFGPASELANVCIWHTAVVWIHGAFDEIIKATAEDRIRHVLFVSDETGEAYAPYDGGADLFVCTAARRDELKHRFSDWLSEHPLGL